MEIILCYLLTLLPILVSKDHSISQDIFLIKASLIWSDLEMKPKVTTKQYSTATTHHQVSQFSNVLSVDNRPFQPYLVQRPHEIYFHHCQQHICVGICTMVVVSFPKCNICIVMVQLNLSLLTGRKIECLEFCHLTMISFHIQIKSGRIREFIFT